MKDISAKSMEADRPLIDLLDGIEFCLNALYKDKDHKFMDEVCQNLKFEELIGVLLLARDEARLRKRLENPDEDEDFFEV